MGEIPLDMPRSKPPASDARQALFALGFRPFFLAAGISAAALIALWLVLWRGVVSPADYYGAIGWHSHEMLFGYVVAVAAGFLLTAVRNWTGIQTPSGWLLAGLAALWLAGRLLPWIALVPGVVVAAVDVLFLPALALSLWRPLWTGRNKVNRIFIALMLAMATANVLVHAEHLGLASSTRMAGTDLMLDLMLWLLLIVTGRVVPFFTEKAVPESRPRLFPLVERSGFVLMGTILVLRLVNVPEWVLGVLLLAMASLQAVRLAYWHHPGVWRIPILWVLFTGYLWLVVGFLLQGLASFELYPRTLATHAFTAGAVGVLTLGMMARVTLGHTGRDMRAAKTTVTAFVLLNLSVMTRVFLPAWMPAATLTWIDLSGGLWLAAFVLFVLIHAPMLWKPRVDGRPG